MIGNKGVRILFGAELGINVTGKDITSKIANVWIPIKMSDSHSRHQSYKLKT